MLPALQAIVDARKPCECGQPRLYGPLCRVCFCGLGLVERAEYLGRLVIETDGSGPTPAWVAALKAYMLASAEAREAAGVIT